MASDQDVCVLSSKKGFIKYCLQRLDDWSVFPCHAVLATQVRPPKAVFFPLLQGAPQLILTVPFLLDPTKRVLCTHAGSPPTSFWSVGSLGLKGGSCEQAASESQRSHGTSCFPGIGQFVEAIRFEFHLAIYLNGSCMHSCIHAFIR